PGMNAGLPLPGGHASEFARTRPDNAKASEFLRKKPPTPLYSPPNPQVRITWHAACILST
ncbi:hypothetical protein ACTO5A_34195, partial [Pseudomonas aeruginosa]